MRCPILLLILMCGLVQPLRAALLDISWMNPHPTGADMFGLATNNPLSPTRYLMVGEGGALATNTDGVTWQFLDSGTRRNLRGVTIGPTQSLVVGDAGTILISQNATTWTSVGGQMADLRDITYGNGYYVAVGSLNGQAHLISSSDGLTWTTQNTGLSEPLNAVAYFGSIFVAVGDKGSVAWSQNGTTWTSVPSITTANLVSITPGNGLFVAISDALSGPRVFVSQLGTTWSPRSLSSTYDNVQLHGIGYYNLNYAIAASGGQIFISSDTTTWSPRVLQQDVDGEMLAVLGSARGWNVVGRGAKIYHGISLLAGWSRYSTGPQFASNALAEGGGYWVSVGNKGQIGGSANGSTWVNRTSNTQQDLRAVTIGGIWWVAAGKDGALMASQLNGDNWIKRNPPILGDFYAATYGAGRYLVGGTGGVLLTSTDTNASSWSAVSSATIDRIITLAYLNGMFIAGTDKGAVLRSSNGTTWASSPTGISGEVRGLAWFNNRYWALVTDASGDSTVLSSPVASVWTVEHSEPGADLHTLAANDSWLASLGYQGNVLSTADAKAWDYQTNVLGTGWNVLEVVNNEFIAAGDWGKIAQLTLGTSPESYFGPLLPGGNGWYQSPWLDWVNITYYPLIYKTEQGWWSCAGPGLSGNQNSFWFYDFQLGWMWTSTVAYPWFFVSDRNAWSFYDSTDGSIRWFYFTDSNTWQAVPLS